MSHKKQESEMMVAALKSIIQSLTSHNIVLAGDWNYVDDLDKLNSSHDRKHLRLKMEQVILENSLSDAFRCLHPQKRDYTHIGNQNHKPKSRLDRIYVSAGLIGNLIACDTRPSFSDHLMCYISLLQKSHRTSAYWKLDNNIH
jgi:exonuclease III